MLTALFLFCVSSCTQNIDYFVFLWYNYIDNSIEVRVVRMPILYEAYDECEKCGKEFKWVHFELVKSRLGSGPLRVEVIPDSPKAKNVYVIDKEHTEYVVGCPHCGFYNHFIHKIEL